MTTQPNVQQVAAGLQKVAQIFTPRQDGTASSAQYPNSELHIRMIHSLVQDGHASMSRTPADLYEYDPPIASPSTRIAAVYLAVECSAGGQETRDGLWSAFRNLAASHPDAAIEVHFERHPLCYFARERSTVVTAGNTDPGRMLEFMATKELRKLGVFGEFWSEPSEIDNVREFRGYCITWLILESAGMVAVQDHVRRLNELMFGSSKPHPSVDPWAYLDAVRKTLE